MNIFIDTNIFLSFYHFTSDDLEELKKLAVLARRGEVTLFLPEQVVDEFRRNRAVKIADAVKRLREQRLTLQLPQISKQYEEYEQLREAQREYERHHAKLIEKIEEDVANNRLEADAVIEELFGVATLIPNSSPLIDRARLRMELGKPPGKKGSLGDALNWEALLEAVPHGSDLYFVTDDSDYSSPLDANTLDPYLLHEWSSNKSSELHTYKRLSSFFGDKFPAIKLATELEKDLLIQELASSTNFAQTHRVISRLSRYSDFTQAQANEIVAVAVTNNQVYWIARDPDVHQFLTAVVNGREQQIDPENLRRLHYALSELEPYRDIPF